MTDILMKVAMQAVLPPPTEGQNAWQYVAYIALFALFSVGGFLFRENSKLRDKMFVDCTDGSGKWQSRAETCAEGASKTADALKLSNDTTLVLAGKVDTIASAQAKFAEKLDRNGEQLRDLLSRLEKCQTVMDRLSDRFSKSAT